MRTRIIYEYVRDGAGGIQKAADDGPHRCHGAVLGFVMAGIGVREHESLFAVVLPDHKGTGRVAQTVPILVPCHRDYSTHIGVT